MKLPYYFIHDKETGTWLKDFHYLCQEVYEKCGVGFIADKWGALWSTNSESSAILQVEILEHFGITGLEIIRAERDYAEELKICSEKL